MPMGPRESHIWTETFKAGADLRTKQFYAVNLSAVQDSMILAIAEHAIGILQDQPNIGEAGSVTLLGISRAVSDGTAPIAIGDFVGPNALGKMVKKATADFGVLGRALDPSTADGTVISVLLMGPGYFRTVAG